MRFTKIMIIAGLALGVCGSVFAGGSDVSVVSTIKNQETVSNTAMDTHNSDSKGDDHSNDHTGSKGNGAGGDDKGGHGGPQCVPEPASMLAMGLGAGFMLIKRRRAIKA